MCCYLFFILFSCYVSILYINRIGSRKFQFLNVSVTPWWFEVPSFFFFFLKKKDSLFDKYLLRTKVFPFWLSKIKYNSFLLLFTKSGSELSIYIFLDFSFYIKIGLVRIGLISGFWIRKEIPGFGAKFLLSLVENSVYAVSTKQLTNREWGQLQNNCSDK